MYPCGVEVVRVGGGMDNAKISCHVVYFKVTFSFDALQITKNCKYLLIFIHHL